MRSCGPAPLCPTSVRTPYEKGVSSLLEKTLLHHSEDEVFRVL